MSIAEDLAALRASHANLADFLRTTGPVDPAGPSLLPDWTIGHVLTHIARNGDSQLSMLAGRPQYPHGRDGRNADIEDGAGRSWDELVADVISSADRVDAAFAEVDDWSVSAEMVLGDRTLDQLPGFRRREVEIHRVDLGLGYTFAELPADYVRMDLRLMEMLWRATKPMGMTGLPQQALDTPPPQRLAWLMGRADIAGLPAAGLF